MRIDTSSPFRCPTATPAAMPTATPFYTPKAALRATAAPHNSKALFVAKVSAALTLIVVFLVGATALGYLFRAIVAGWDKFGLLFCMVAAVAAFWVGVFFLVRLLIKDAARAMAMVLKAARE